MLDLNTILTTYVIDTAAANTYAIVDLPSAAKPSRWSIGGIAWAYSSMVNDTSGGVFAVQLDTSAGLFVHATPATDTTGLAALSVLAASTTLVLGVEITEVGFDSMIFAEPVKFAPGYRIQIGLADGGGSHRVSVLGAKLV